MTVRPQSGPAVAHTRMAAVALLGAIGASSTAEAQNRTVSDTALVVQATRACFSDEIRVAGYFVPRGQTWVTLNADGYRVTDVFVKEGDTVAADQELIRLARLGGTDSPAAQGAAGGPPATLSLKAPAAGTVSATAAVVGGLTHPGGEPLVKLTTDADLDLFVEIPSLYVTRIKAGSPARILLVDGSESPGSVRVPASAVDPATQFGRARLAAVRGPGISPGIFARALIDTGRSCGVAVPRAAIVRQNDTTAVEVLRKGKIETRRVRVGLSSEDSVEIREGLSEGDSVIANAGLAF